MLFKAKDSVTGHTELFSTTEVASLTWETGQVHFTSGRSITVGTNVVNQIWNDLEQPSPTPGTKAPILG